MQWRYFVFVCKYKVAERCRVRSHFEVLKAVEYRAQVTIENEVMLVTSVEADESRDLRTLRSQLGWHFALERYPRVFSSGPGMFVGSFSAIPDYFKILDGSIHRA
jgi:hypothetical protein